MSRGIKRVFEIDKEIVCYNTREELLDKIKYYLKFPEKEKNTNS